MSAAAASFCGEAAGLVLSSTRCPRSALERHAEGVERIKQGGLLVDRVVTRLKKMKHGVMTAARLAGEVCQRTKIRHRPAMITLTYAPGENWRPRHLTEFLHTCRKFCKRAGKDFRYVWVAEMQQRGVVHYHVIVWLPKGFKLPKPDERGWWPYGMSNIQWAQKAAGYLAKYASKGQEPGAPAFPKGIRISGNGGLDAQGRIEFRFWRAPSEAREFFGVGADIRRIKGGRFDAATGLFWESPWRLVNISGKPYLLPKEANP